ncbi:MAG: Jag N-terminal domain-containing protein [Candidatus Omnitrophica bacterium]|nr:Jag N-terminal domain-containing protein [Candidatus Omnitrophota bacterium]
MQKMDSVEVQGRTSQEAIKIALKKLGATRKQVKVEILSEENKGLFGMNGSRLARVRVSLKE